MPSLIYPWLKWEKGRLEDYYGRPTNKAIRSKKNNKRAKAVESEGN